jgi:YVTN family beta-propeller protein
LRVHSIIFIVSLLFFSGCAGVSSVVKPALEEEGEVFVYIEPFPQEAERLRFQLEELSAVRGDGTTVPLSLSLSEFKRSDMGRQRLVASGRLSPGRYTGLSFKAKDASLRTEEGAAALLVPSEPLRINFPFDIVRKKAVVLDLSLRYAESVKDRSRFIPSFSIIIPSRPLATLTGYVTNHDSQTITVFDKRSGRVAGVIPTGNGPLGMALDQKLAKAYVALSDIDAIEQMDVTEGNMIKRLSLTTGDRPRELALTPDGRFLLTVNAGSSSVSIVDTLSLIEVNRIAVGNDPRSVLVDPVGRRAYVFNTLSNTITVIDIANKAAAAVISTEPGPVRGQFNRKGDKLYVIYEGNPYLTVIDPFSLSVIKRMFVGPGVSSIKVNTTTDMIYLGRKRDSTVEVYDPFSLMPGDFIVVSSGVDYLTIDGEENNLFTVLPDKKTVTAVNLISKKVVFEIDVGDNASWVTMMGER